ncbi:uncharacterized protein FOMMEDRAFT_134143 [Fomitiporia mediterranea MF3/22]|uniref:uncharacterized protein n=1 Tax=Fomitiporia mediterranea (strain MF3/22) TaxID=694068 RepID=UPI0004409268|nr:uncharacterized protein FOMMEDRAFT_134143 [Fomitiporia mediterranea MF3/22]EJD02988.1 hypothetical protein FOMMEDRAFT_134143 [Fomitiporia mediterranea MF3/22]
MHSYDHHHYPSTTTLQHVRTPSRIMSKSNRSPKSGPMDSPIPTISVDTSALDSPEEEMYYAKQQFLSPASAVSSVPSRRHSFLHLDPHPTPNTSPRSPTYTRPRPQYTLNYSHLHSQVQVRGAQTQPQAQIRAQQLLSVADFLAQQEREMAAEVQRVSAQIRDLRQCQGQHQVRDGMVVESSGSDADTEEVCVVVITAV